MKAVHWPRARGAPGSLPALQRALRRLLTAPPLRPLPAARARLPVVPASAGAHVLTALKTAERLIRRQPRLVTWLVLDCITLQH